MDKNNKRICVVCGEIHGKGDICPVIKKKLEKYNKWTKRNFLVGNIFLECFYKDIDFFQILLEIAERNEEAYSLLGLNTVINSMEIIEYFAVSLNCRSKDFYRDPDKTLNEYSELLKGKEVENAYCGWDETGHVGYISCEYEPLDYQEQYLEQRRANRFEVDGYRFVLSKEREEDNSWSYVLDLALPKVIKDQYKFLVSQDKEPKKSYLDKLYSTRSYSWGTMRDVASNRITLAYAKSGELKDNFERELVYRWTEEELLTEGTYDDSRFDLWMEKLERATANRLLDWRRYGNHFSTRYDNVDIEIEIDMNSSGEDCAYLYVRNQLGGLGIRFGHKQIASIEFRKLIKYAQEELTRDKKTEIEDQEPRIISKEGLRIIALAKQIEKQIDFRKENNLYSGLPMREIKHTDVIVTTQSMICHKKKHMITPLCGIVQLLTEENEQVSYEIYVGYCIECNHYYVFKSDYYEMLKMGKPLCAVYQEVIDDEKKQPYGAFRYKSQSVLNAMGYTVGMDDNLSASERWEILSRALQSNLIEIHDLLSFLNWLVRTRRPQAKYQVAVRKWMEDIEFVENYEKSSREVVKIDSITLK